MSTELPDRIWLNDMGTTQATSFEPIAGAFEHHEYRRAVAPISPPAGDTLSDAEIDAIQAEYMREYPCSPRQFARLIERAVRAAAPAAPAQPVAFVDHDQPNNVAWCPSGEKLPDITPLFLAAAPAEDQDARRYRQLRRGQHWSVINGIGDSLRAEALDAAIDAVDAADRDTPTPGMQS